jgi:hypothetical protein
MRKRPVQRRMASSEKLTLFLRAMLMLPKLSLWSAQTEIKEIRRAEGDSMLTYRRAENEGH